MNTRAKLAKAYIGNGDVVLGAGQALLEKPTEGNRIVAAGQVGRAIENYLKAYLELLGSPPSHTHNLASLVVEIRHMAGNVLGRLGSRPELQELNQYIVRASYSRTTNLVVPDSARVAQFVQLAVEIRAWVVKCVDEHL